MNGLCRPGLLGAALAVALAPAAFLHPVRISGRSMEPRMVPGTVCLALRAWCAGVPAPGQIWLVRTPAGTAVKRLVGLPGDRVEIRAGGLWINGRPVYEPYTKVDEPEWDGPWATGQGYFLLGDNRGASRDCRTWGPLPGGALVGRIILQGRGYRRRMGPDIR